MRGFFISLSVVCTFWFQSSWGQDSYLIERSKEELKGSILEQYEYILEKSYNSSIDSVPFENIKVRYLKAFRIHLTDSLKAFDTKINTLEDLNSQLENQLASSRSEFDKIEQENTRLNHQQESISFLGILFSKNTYHVLVWSLITLLVLLLAYLFSVIKKGKVEAKELVQEAHESQETLENFRRASMEREQKLKREILDLTKKVEKPIDATAVKKSSNSQSKTTTQAKEASIKKTPKK